MRSALLGLHPVEAFNTVLNLWRISRALRLTRLRQACTSCAIAFRGARIRFRCGLCRFVRVVARRCNLRRRELRAGIVQNGFELIFVHPGLRFGRLIKIQLGHRATSGLVSKHQCRGGKQPSCSCDKHQMFHSEPILRFSADVRHATRSFRSVHPLVRGPAAAASEKRARDALFLEAITSSNYWVFI